MSLSTTAGLLSGTALIALMAWAAGTPEQAETPRSVVSIPSAQSFALAQAVPHLEGAAPATATPSESSGNPGRYPGMGPVVGEPAESGGMMGFDDGSPAVAGGFPAGTGGASAGMGGFPPALRGPVIPEPTSEVAQAVLDAMSQEVDLPFNSILLDELPARLRETAKVPVLLDDRGIGFATSSSAGEVQAHFKGGSMPLRTALRQLLRPLGLKAVIEDEGLVITADPAALVHMGVGASRWINVDNQVEQQIASLLSAKTDVEFVDAPLSQVVQSISKTHKVPMLVDKRAMAEIGLSADEPVSIVVSGMQVGSILKHVLRSLDLTYMVDGEALYITTIEAAESNLLSRIYWLEGTGIARGDFNSIIDTIQTCVQPETWEALGGPSTMVPLNAARPALLISTTYPNHETIERLLNALRENHFGRDPVAASATHPPGGGGFF